jgi:hemerythrin
VTGLSENRTYRIAEHLQEEVSVAYMNWKAIYSVHIAEIDEQHKKLIGMINELHDAMKEGRGSAVISLVLKEMIAYAASHFATEEDYMSRFAFQGYAVHKAEHGAFTAKVLDFQREYSRGSISLTFDVMDFLEDWLVKHIQGTDKQYALFLNMKGIK